MRVSNQCDSCTAPATLAICNRCTEELRAQLHALAHGPKINGHTTAGLLDACEDVVLRRTRLSTGGGHRKKGDEQPAPFAPDEERLDKDGHTIPSRQEKAARLLKKAGVVAPEQVSRPAKNSDLPVRTGPAQPGVASRTPRQLQPMPARPKEFIEPKKINTGGSERGAAAPV